MEDVSILRIIFAFLFVVALIGVMHFLLKKYDWQKRLHAGRKGARLTVVESTMIDPKHKLVLVRRDDTEHLLLLGHQSDQVVETGIAAKAVEGSVSTNV